MPKCVGGMLDGAERQTPPNDGTEQAFGHQWRGKWHIYKWDGGKQVWVFYKSIHGKSEKSLLRFMDREGKKDAPGN